MVPLFNVQPDPQLSRLHAALRSQHSPVLTAHVFKAHASVLLLRCHVSVQSAA